MSLRPLFVPTPVLDRVDEGRILLRDGSIGVLRAARPSDAPALGDFFKALSPDSKRLRFLSSAAGPPPEIVQRLCDSSDPHAVITLLVTRRVDDHERIIGTGSYVARDPTSAEVAFAIDDRFHGKGIGTVLLERLALLALRNGITRFWAVTSSENRPMLDVFRDSGFAVHFTPAQGEIEVDLSVIPTNPSVNFADLRDRLATKASLTPFFLPTGIAVVGASRDPTSIGRRVLDGLVARRFVGAIYPVNPAASHLGDLPCYPSVRQIPAPVDLAIIVVRHDAVLSVVDDCAAHGVRALLVISAGFAEIGPEGRERQQRLVDSARGYGMRIIGPNCLGLMNTDAAVRLNASFAPCFPSSGPIAMLSQSGALGIAVLAMADQRGLGLSSFVSVGNKADVSSNDLLQYWEDDARTSTILLYLESLGNPRRFARIARRVGRQKPIVALKSGRGQAGARAAGSHTAALAVNETAVEALFRQTGVIRATTLEDMFDVGMFLSSQPLPAGRRVGIVTNAGGPGILCADACEAASLSVPSLSPETRSRLAPFLPSMASLDNPVDMIASASPEQYRRALDVLLDAPDIDALIVLHTPVTATVSTATEAAILDGVVGARTTRGNAKPVVACVMPEGSRLLGSGDVTIPVYAFPELAARSLGRAANYAAWRSRPEGVIPDFEDLDPATARSVVKRAMNEQAAGWLSADDAAAVLTAYGLPVPALRKARSADDAIEQARALGFPVAIKLASQSIVHKTELGVVYLNVQNEDAVRAAFETIKARLSAAGQLDAMDGVLVQPMFSGVELIVGVTHDSIFGPLVAFGLGGIHVEILRDVVFRITPLSDRDAQDMIQEIRGYPLLCGYRGHPAADVDALARLLLRVSRLVDDIDEIVGLDLNPVFAMSPGQGCQIADARIQVARTLRPETTDASARGVRRP